MLCFSCSKQKEKIHLCKSTLLKGIDLFMCQTCIDDKYEPRWVVILAGRQNGSEYVREYIIKSRYFGKPISAEEIIA
jgi:protein-arginine kinase activator protein McsA